MVTASSSNEPADSVAESSLPNHDQAALAEPAIDHDRIRADQVREVAYFIPMMLAASAFSSAIFTWVAWNTADRATLLIWLTAMWALVARALHSWLRNRGNAKTRVSARMTRKAVTNATIQGMTWAALPALFFVGAPTTQQIVILGVMMALIFGGAMALIRIPPAALAYAGTMLTSVIAVLFVEGGTAYNFLAVLCAGYGAIGFLGVRHHSRSAHTHSIIQQEVEHQREVIMLLLKDFEKGKGDWLWETDPKGRLTSISGGFAKTTGVKPHHLIGRRLADLHLGDACVEWQKLNALVAKRQAIKDVLLPVHLQDRQCWWTLTALPRLDEAQKFIGYRGVGRDVTVAREAELALKEAKETAERANTAKSKFLAVLSHELRSPLNAVIGFSDIIAEQSFGRISVPKYVEYATEIRDSSRHLLTIIDDLLDIARIESGAVEINDEEFSAEKLFDGVRRLLMPLAEKRNVRLSRAKSDVETLLHADPRLVRQILINLVTNAVKFTPADGEVALGTTLAADGSAVMWVRDTGIGIPPEFRDRVFEPFTQIDGSLSRNFEGVGLGLSIALHLARAHGGELVITDAPERGTIVHFTLPSWRVVKTERLVA